MAGYSVKKSVDGTYHQIPKTNITRALDAVKRYDLNRVIDGGLVFPGSFGPTPTVNVASIGYLDDADAAYVASGVAVQNGRLVRWSAATIRFATPTASRNGVSVIYIPPSSSATLPTDITATPTYYTASGYTWQPSVSKLATPLAFVTRSMASMTAAPTYALEQYQIDNDARAQLFAPIKLIAG